MLHHDKHVLLAIAIVASSTPSASAGPSNCTRWRIDNMDNCELLEKPAGCMLELRDIELADRIRYASSSYQACRRFTKIAYPGKKWARWPILKDANGTTTTLKNGSVAAPIHFSAYCLWDGNDDGVIDDDDYAGSTTIFDLEDVTPAPYCACTVNGPYTDGTYPDFTWNGHLLPSEVAIFQSHAFPKSLRKAILDTNLAKHGEFRSDAPFDAYDELQKDKIYDDDAAEVDHIIPRTDPKGCICGDPTPNNGALISRVMNRHMSNHSPNANKERAQMFAKWVTCPRGVDVTYHGDPRMQAIMRPTDGEDLDEGTIDLAACEVPRSASLSPDDGPVETAGCSVSHGTGAIGLGLALTVFLRRRRSAQHA
jgi:hypothetical protein